MQQFYDISLSALIDAQGGGRHAFKDVCIVGMTRKDASSAVVYVAFEPLDMWETKQTMFNSRE